MTQTTGLRAATYSRYSSDNQRETSIEDQERLQDQRADALGATIVLRYSDREISASVPTGKRPGGREMLEAARRGDFDILIIECLDRCWRDIIDQEQVIRGLEFIGLRLIGISDGYDTENEGRELPRVVYGAVNQEYLRALAKKTHRGLTGQVCRGGYAGGLSYGYQSVPEGSVRKLVVDNEQAEWVRWIFSNYAEGWSTQRIAAELNRLGVKTRSGRTWAVSALYGSPNKGSGVLNNELYVGRYIWNRSKWVTHPTTHKRTRLDRPAAEWMVEERPELRIVPDEIWQAVRARMDGTRLSNGGKDKGARPKTLLGGLMTCGKCGGSVIAVSAKDYGCTAHKDRGEAVCSGVRIRRRDTDMRLMSVIRTELLSQASIADVRDRVMAILDEQRKTANSAARTLKARIDEVAGEIERLVGAIAATGHSDALLARLRDAEARKASLANQAAQRATPPIKIDDLMARYRKQLMNLEAALAADPERARPALREYFGEIRIEESTDSAWAAFTPNPGRLLLKAVGDSGYGCGGRI